MVKTLKNYLVSYFLPWSVKEQRRCVATVKMNIYLSRTFVNTWHTIFMLFLIFFYIFFYTRNPETNARPAGPSDGKNDKVSPIIRTCHFVPRSDGSPLSLFPCVPQSVHLFHFNVHSKKSIKLICRGFGKEIYSGFQYLGRKLELLKIREARAKKTRSNIGSDTKNPLELWNTEQPKAAPSFRPLVPEFFCGSPWIFRDFFEYFYQKYS